MTLTKKLSHALIALLLGLTGLGIVLYAWQLPPFSSSTVMTENAYVRGQVTTIAPQLSGYVTEVPVQDFQPVEAGQVLARLDDRRYRQAVAQAEAALASARANLANNAQAIHSAEATVAARRAAQGSAEAARDTAQTNFDRAQQLKDHSIVSTSAYDQADLSLRQARAGVDEAISAVAVATEALKSARGQQDSLAAAVTSAEAALALARIDLENTVVRAPEVGRLGQVSARVGQFVSAGTTLMSHVSPQTWVIANFKETQVAGMQVGQPVDFTVDALGGRHFAGQLERFAPATGSEFSVLSATNATGNFTKIAQRLPVRIAIDPDQPGLETLVPGLSVVVHVDRAARPS